MWGDLTVITSKVSRKHGDSVHLVVVDSQGNVRLRRNWPWGYATLLPNKPPTDCTGNVFLLYNPGRYDGLIVLRGAGGHLDDFGTLPGNGGGHYYGSGPFGYYTKAQDKAPADDVLEIRQFKNDCRPGCSDGTITSRLYVWDGKRYVRHGPVRTES